MRPLIPLTIYLTEEELQLLIEQTQRDNESIRQHVEECLQPDAVAATAMVQWLRGRAARERGAA